MTTLYIDVKDAANITTSIAKPNPNGRAAAADSRPVVFSSEDFALFPASIGEKTKTTAFAVTLATDEQLLALIGATNETAPGTDTAASGLNGREQRVAQNISAMSVKLPATIGQKTQALSLGVTLASDETLLARFPATLGQKVKTTAFGVTLASDEDLLSRFPTTLGQKTKATAFGVTLSSDEDLLSRFPATLGQKARAASYGVTLSTEDIALFPASIGQKLKTTSLAVTLSSNEDLLTLIGAVNETAPASDTASSGLNGRDQRIAQNITTMSGKLPATLGQKTKALAMGVTLASDEDLLARFPATLGQKTKATAFGVTLASDEDLLARLGATNETAPSTDTAASGINGREQRVAQNITALRGQFPTTLTTGGGALKVAPVDGAGDELDYTTPAETKQANLVVSGLTPVVIDTSASGDITVVSGVASQTTRIHRMKLSAKGATDITIKRGSTVLDVFHADGNGWGLILRYDGNPWYATAANEAFVINSSNAVDLDGSVEYLRTL